ncbi:MAG: hypothetical protein CL678_09320 [Bdellovibrionaceae bacterium]|nr:hypothetical protein [Pseudobdellovibrionaceae bacterium]
MIGGFKKGIDNLDCLCQLVCMNFVENDSFLKPISLGALIKKINEINENLGVEEVAYLIQQATTNGEVNSERALELARQSLN